MPASTLSVGTAVEHAYQPGRTGTVVRVFTTARGRKRVTVQFVGAPTPTTHDAGLIRRQA